MTLAYCMQILCHVVPSLVKLRKEGLDGHEKIKAYMCVRTTGPYVVFYYCLVHNLE